ncbi:MAG: HNH endonuclease [Candidatus Micrarchaeota archaeon]
MARHPGYASKSWAEYYKKNKDILLAKGREYAKTPRGKEINLIKCSKRRARQSGATSHFSAKDFRRLQGIYPVCVYCGKKNELQVEHVVPLDKGGRNDVTNLVIACKSCNSSKRNETPEDWFKRRAKKKAHFYSMVKEQILIDKKTGKKRKAYLPKTE